MISDLPVALGGGASDLVYEALELALAEVEERYGVDPTRDLTYSQIDGIWLAIVRAAIARVKAQRAGNVGGLTPIDAAAWMHRDNGRQYAAADRVATSDVNAERRTVA